MRPTLTHSSPMSSICIIYNLYYSQYVERILFRWQKKFKLSFFRDFWKYKFQRYKLLRKSKNFSSNWMVGGPQCTKGNKENWGRGFYFRFSLDWGLHHTFVMKRLNIFFCTFEKHDLRNGSTEKTLRATHISIRSLIGGI